MVIRVILKKDYTQLCCEITYSRH